MALTPEERSLRARIAAHAQHAQGATNTAPARAGFRAKFEKEVDPDGVLDPDERARRAEHAFKAHMARLSLAASKKRRAGGGKGAGA